MTRAITYKHLGQNGRLGNQLFQVAATYGYARRMSADLILPGWDYAKYFSLQCSYNPDIVNMVTHVYNEPYFHYMDILTAEQTMRVKDWGNGAYILSLHGYFQSERYFVREQILEMFAFEKSLKEKCEGIIHDVHTSVWPLRYGDKINIVSLHMRFGDYVGNQYYADLHQNEYYIRAINHMKRSRPNEDFLFLVFSDDREKAMACAEHLKSVVNNFDFLMLSNTTEVEDMCLQSMCDHHIIANSSFSWWSSYLCRNEHKQVIAPAAWFGPQANLNTKDLYRPEMIKL